MYMYSQLHCPVQSYIPITVIFSLISAVSPLTSTTLHVYRPASEDLTPFKYNITLVIDPIVALELGALSILPLGPIHDT